MHPLVQAYRSETSLVSVGLRDRPYKLQLLPEVGQPWCVPKYGISLAKIILPLRGSSMFFSISVSIEELFLRLARLDAIGYASG
ncbi:hypothetical protein KR51_00006660 [Rubidibacter lacunae KORDI 51-2]|uniref:Uncharacterized protein n=1 Tax=Rubidibacter lacunae KORDI 51-2 TaxID=582515 RepID=U5DLV3_9CHRO|nr:hypothetical protein KR51_00006660 [Rubidibacter lacunae KORDI 51-2]